MTGARFRTTGLALALALAGALACSSSRSGHGSARDSDTLVVSRGALEDTVLMTGTLRAVDSTALSVPRPRRWAWMSVRFMAEDGARVSAGEVVLEFDNTEFVSRLEELELQALEAENKLTLTRANNAVLEADKQIEVEVTENLLERAKISAEVPAHVLPEREYQERQLQLEQSRVAVERARDDLAGHRRASALAEDIERIALDTARREIESARSEIEAFTMRAPKDGILIVGDHFREGRKIKVGDTLFPGMPVVEIPDLSRMHVEARLSDVDDGRVAPGMRATCVLDAFADRAFEGVIREVSPVAQSEDERSLRRSFEVIVELENIDPERMRPGMSVKVMVHARATADEGSALIAPRAGLDVIRARAFLAGGGEAEVDIDWCSPQACVVRSGLSEGDRLRAGGAR